MSGKTEESNGGCVCGALRFLAAGPLRPVVACHCSQCRRAYTNYGAFTAVRRASLSIADPEALAWYDSSPNVRRGFCRHCGSGLFYDMQSNDFVSVAAGAFDQPSGLRQLRHIFVADKADFYVIGDGLEQLPQDQGGDTWPGGRGS